MPSVKITIDGREISAQPGQTILEAAQAAGIDVPTLCHHPSLEPIGACRICLVEVEKQRTLQPACTFKVTDGMVVHTESEKAVETRKFLLELLFSERNHYCMYCQMSGDCELQSMAYRYGLDSWTYPRPYTPMPVDATRQYFVMDHNRCILCRRCIRACSELVGNYTLGLGGRGAKSMIVADMNVPFGDSSCISCGTCLQVCPTGALMDRRSAYRGREVEVDRVKSTCTACSIGCGIELISRDNQLLRVEGDWDADVNKGLLCVAGRFDVLTDNQRRMFTPMVRRDGQLRPATWDEALDVVAKKLASVDGSAIAAMASPHITNEALGTFARLFKSLGAGSLANMKLVPQFLAEPEGSLDVLDEAGLYLVVGEDLDADHQVAGIAVRRGVMNRGARLILVDSGGDGLADMAHHRFQADQIEDAIALAQGSDAPVVVYGAAAGDVLPRLREALAAKAQFVGLVPGSNGRGAIAAGLNGAFETDGVQSAFVLSADDNVDEALLNKLAGIDFVVAQTCYQNALAERADVVLPSATWAEKSGTVTNTEGRVQPIHAALRPPASVKDDTEILEALGGKLA
jgi:formate dehydrogenase major subunit